jgi:hypothetical protein
MNRRNGNWLAPSINQLTATAVTDLAALSGYRSIKPAAATTTIFDIHRRDRVNAGSDMGFSRSGHHWPFGKVKQPELCRNAPLSSSIPRRIASLTKPLNKS